MKKIYLTTLFLIFSILLTGGAYGNNQIERSFLEKNPPQKKIVPYGSSKKVAQTFRSSTKKKKKRNQWTRKKSNNDWSIMLGGLGALKPKYKGSNQYEVSGFPFIDTKYKKIFFLNFAKA